MLNDSVSFIIIRGMENHTKKIVYYHNLSIWPFISAISVFLVFVGFIFYFVYEIQILGIIIIGSALAIIVFSSAGWAKEIFFIGHDEKLGFRGIIWFVCAETVIFGVIIVSFISSRIQFFNQWVEWIPEHGFNYFLLAILTLILWASSYTIWRAEKSLKHNDVGSYRLWLLLTMILGSLFLLLHAIEWVNLWKEGFTVSANMFGTGFYTLTGVHASHVLVGVLIQFILLLNSGKSIGYITPIKAGSFYWHFVDIAWLFVASTAYILGGYVRF